jgi:hypothetical protein
MDRQRLFMLPLRDLHGVVGCAAAPKFVIVPKGAIHIGNVVKIGPSPPRDATEKRS